MRFENLMTDFARAVGAEGGLSADADGVVRIGIDGFEVAFMDVPEADSLLMWCDLGEMPSGEKEPQIRWLLGESFADRGACVFSRGEGEHVFAHRYVPLGRLDFDVFLNGPLEEFLAFLSRRTGAADGAGFRDLRQGAVARMSDDCHDLLKAFADAVGIVNFPPPGEDGVCRVSNGVVAFGFGELEESRELLVEANLCTLPVTGREKFLNALAQANFMGQGAAGGAFAVSDEDRVVLFRRFQLEGLSSEALADAFEGLAAVAFEWRRIADDYGPVAAEREARADEANEIRERAFVGEFIRV